MKEEIASSMADQAFWDRNCANNSLHIMPRSRIQSISQPQEDFINRHLPQEEFTRPYVQDSKSAISVINHQGQATKRPENHSNEFLYIESKRARIEREKAEKRRRYEDELTFDESDLALASVPGKQFDPRKNSLDMEDLRPQAIVKKRKKIQVPQEEKDEKYWRMREKNNAATKLAREAKRLKENQIMVRTAFLENDNQRMKIMLEDLKVEHTKRCMERDVVKKQLEKKQK